MVRASKNWCQIRADQLTDFVSDKTSYPENQLYLSVFVWLCTKPRYVDFQAQPQLTKISENPKLKQHLATVASPVLEAGFSSVFGVEDTREGNGYSVWHGSVGHVSWTFFLISGFIKGEVQDAEKSWMHLKPSNHDLYTTSWCHWCWGGMIRSLRRRDVSPGWVGKGTQWRILSARWRKSFKVFLVHCCLGRPVSGKGVQKYSWGSTLEIGMQQSSSLFVEARTPIPKSTKAFRLEGLWR